MIDWSIPKNLEMAKKILKYSRQDEYQAYLDAGGMPEGYEETQSRPSAAELMKQLDEFRDELYKCEREDKNGERNAL